MQVTSSLGSFVWHDINGNGTQESGEDGIANVTVTLHNADGLVQTTTTDAMGEYQFDDVVPNTYHINFDLASATGYDAFTKLDIGGDDTDSDADPANGNTIDFVVNSGYPLNPDWDAVIFKFIPSTVSTTASVP